MKKLLNRFKLGFRAFKKTYQSHPWDGWDTFFIVIASICLILEALCIWFVIYYWNK